MKLISISDLHLRPTPPINRKDNYVDKQFEKLEFILSYAKNINASIIIAGDVLDRATNHPSWFISRVLGLFTDYSDVNVCVIPGNHDLLGHSLENFYQNTVSLLNYAPNILMFDTYFLDQLEDGTLIHYLPFGLTPEEEPTKDTKNILVLHEPVYENSVPFYMKDGITVDQLEAKYPGYDLYLAGDIHIPCNKSKTLVSGSMMRMTVAQKEHKPQFFVIDTETLEVETVFIPIEQDVWRDEIDIAENSVFKEELKELALAMSKQETGLSYPDVVKELSGEHWAVLDKIMQNYNK